MTFLGSRRRIVRVLPALASLALAACAVWAPHHLPATRLAAAPAVRTVRVTQVDGTRRVLRRPALVGDSLVGRGGAVALRDVRRVEVRRVSAWRTAAVSAGGLAVAAAAAFLALASTVAE